MFRYLRRQGFHQKLFDGSIVASFNAIKSYKSFLEMFISETRLLKGFNNVTKNRENAVIPYRAMGGIIDTLSCYLILKSNFCRNQIGLT